MKELYDMMTQKRTVLLKQLRTLIDLGGQHLPWDNDFKDAITHVVKELNEQPASELDAKIDLMHDSIYYYQVGSVSHRYLLEDIDNLIEDSYIIK